MIGRYTIGALTKIMSLYKNVSRGDSSDPLKIISDVPPVIWMLCTPYQE